MSDIIYNKLSKLSSIDTTANKSLATKTLSLIESCNRIRLQDQEALSWAALLDDFTAFSTSLGLHREACPINFNALAVVPSKVPADITISNSIPTILSVYPGDDTYENIKHLQIGLEAVPKMKAKLDNIELQDIRQIRGNIQTFNRAIDEARLIFQKKASEAINQLEALADSSYVSMPKRENANQNK